MNPIKKNFKATVILDTRGRTETLDELVENVKGEIVAVSGEVTGFESLGVREFSRPTDRKYTAGPFVQIYFTAPSDSNKHLLERMRLNRAVYSSMIESA